MVSPGEISPVPVFSSKRPYCHPSTGFTAVSELSRMGHSNASSEKVALSQDVLPFDDLEAAGTRVVAFNPQEHGEIHEEKVHYGHPRSRGVEMKREMTKEDMELAAAGYEHLEELKTKAKTGGSDGLDKVDIVEHHLNFDELRKELDTQIDAKDPGGSYGLTADEAKARLTRDGPNILTPPKKKSALRKVMLPNHENCWAHNSIKVY